MTNMSTNNPSSIQCRDSNSQPLDHLTHVIITHKSRSWHLKLNKLDNWKFQRCHLALKHSQFPAYFRFKQFLHNENSRLKRDTNSNHQSGRQACSPLGHNQGVISFALKVHQLPSYNLMYFAIGEQVFKNQVFAISNLKRPTSLQYQENQFVLVKIFCFFGWRTLSQTLKPSAAAVFIQKCGWNITT